MKKAIVTGANGFVGAAICKELAAQDIEVIAIVRNQSSDINNICSLKGIQIVYCELKDYRQLKEKITERNIDVFYHFAWDGTSGPKRGEHGVQIDNVRYTCDAVEACADIQCKRFVFAASIMEYEVEKMMQTSAAPRMNTLYCTAKLSADYMARTIASNLQIEYVRGLISNIYGPGEVSARLINTSIRKMLCEEHCAFSDGKQMYDFIYITDAAKAFLAIGKAGIANQTYYIGSQSPRPLKEFLIEMKNQIAPNQRLGLGEIKLDGVSLSYKEFDKFALERDTGFIPEISFAEGIKKTAEWIKNNNDCV